jgi:hypothetical protein
MPAPATMTLREEATGALSAQQIILWTPAATGGHAHL